MAAQRRTRKQATDLEVAERLRSMLMNTAEGRRSVADDRIYPELRNALASRGYDLPSLVFTHPSLDSVTAALKRISGKAGRAEAVRDELNPFLDMLREPRSEPVDSAVWTGQEGRTAKLKLVRGLLPLAQNAVESMITTLSEPNANGAPLLDSRVEAIEELRKLHHALGELLSAVDSGHLDDELGQNLQAEVARFAKRTAKALRDDPMPYLSSALLLGLFTACGIPGLGAYLGGVALTVKKHARH
jgi:hypothetical protein